MRHWESGIFGFWDQRPSQGDCATVDCGLWLTFDYWHLSEEVTCVSELLHDPPTASCLLISLQHISFSSQHSVTDYIQEIYQLTKGTSSVTGVKRWSNLSATITACKMSCCSKLVACVFPFLGWGIMMSLGSNGGSENGEMYRLCNVSCM